MDKSSLAKAAIFIGVGAAIGAAIGMIGQALIASGIMAPLGFGMFAGMGPGALAGGAIGAAAGGAAFAYGASKAPSFQGLGVNQIAHLRTGKGEFHGGESVFKTETFDMERTNTILERIDVHIGDLGMSA